MEQSGETPARSPVVLALTACAALLFIFAAIAWSAVCTKTATYDEPFHALGAWTMLHRHDYRIDADNPPLWKLLLALPNGPNALKTNFNSPNWTQEPQNQWMQYQWTVETLYQTPGNDPDKFIRRSRAMMLIVGVLLGILICWWAWQLAGPLAAVTAVAFFSLDPNFLAHAPLVKNDVSQSLAMAALTIALWRAGQQLTWKRAAAIVLLTSVVLTVKWSGLLALGLVPLLLGIRAIFPQPWAMLGRVRRAWPARWAIVAALTATTWLAAYLAIWASFGFRFAPTPDPAVRFNTAILQQVALANEVLVRNGDRPVTFSQIGAATPSVFLQVMATAERHQLLPQACIDGLLYTYQSGLVRPAFLLGHRSEIGWWYYFPIAIAVKTPLATLAAFVLSAAAALVIRIRARRKSAHTPDPDRAWSILCLALPSAIYLALAMHSNLNIGLRHILPIYPALFIGLGWIAAAAIHRWGWPALAVTASLAIWLAIATLSAYPDFIDFFNRAAGGERGGIRILADSNLDWGQDLKQLVAWQQQHPDRSLYLAYFGQADPKYYGLRFTRLPGAQTYGDPPAWPKARQGVVLAISATFLQGLFLTDPSFQAYYAAVAQHRPMDVLGGTIYLYSLSGKKGATTAAVRR